MSSASCASVCVPAPALAAENLFLRKQLALYQERHVQAQTCHQCHPSRPGLARALVRLAPGPRRCATRNLDPLASPGIPAVLAVEVPARTATASLRICKPSSAAWRGRIRPGGRNASPMNSCSSLACGYHHAPYGNIYPSACTLVEATRATSQRWATFVRNHAQAIVACDFCVVVTATFRLLYVFVRDGTRDPPHSAWQCDHASNGPMDTAAAARSDPSGSSLSLPPP